MEHDRSDGSGSLPGRLLAALIDPAAKGGPALLVPGQGALAVLEWPEEGKGLVLLACGGGHDADLPAVVERVIAGHQGGVLFLAVVGGGPEVQDLLKASDRAARDPRRLGLYQLDPEGRLVRAAGRRLAQLESAAQRLGSVQPLSPDDIPAAIERGRAKRAEAVAFARSVSSGFARVTVALIGVCFLLFALSAGAGSGEGSPLARFGVDGLAVLRGDFWRLVSYAFLHANATHLLVNMFALYGLGSLLENLLGWRRYLTIYLSAALAGGVASAVAGLVRVEFGGALFPTVGASGAIWGLMGATLGLVLRRERVFPLLFARGLKRQLIAVLLLNVLLSFLPGIDLWAHLGGGLVGLWLGRTRNQAPNGRP